MPYALGGTSHKWICLPPGLTTNCLSLPPVLDPLAWAVDAQSAMGGSGPICLPTGSHLGQSCGEVAGLPMQENHSDCSRMAQYALVLGSCDHVKSDSFVPAQSAYSTVKSDSQYSVKPKSACMALRATAIKEQGFSEAVAAQIEAPQEDQPDQSMRQVDHFYMWCLSNRVDFRTPPCKVNS